jgi:hypothetical protein
LCAAKGSVRSIDRRLERELEADYAPGVAEYPVVIYRLMNRGRRRKSPDESVARIAKRFGWRGELNRSISNSAKQLVNSQPQ